MLLCLNIISIRCCFGWPSALAFKFNMRQLKALGGKAPSLKFYDELALFVTLSHNSHRSITQSCSWTWKKSKHDNYTEKSIWCFMGEAPNGRKAMMSWRFCDDRSRSVTRSSHWVKVTTIQAPGSADQLLTNLVILSHPTDPTLLLIYKTSLRLDLRYAKRRVCHIRVCHIQKFKTQI